MQEENWKVGGMVLEGLVRAGIFEEVTYLGLRVLVPIVWDWKARPLSMRKGGVRLYFLTTGGVTITPEGGDFVSLFRGPARVF